MFKAFRNAVRAQFDAMASQKLFVTAVDKDQLWERYLASFPEGTNPMFRERTEHDCQACKSFIRHAGAIVAVNNGQLVSIWDVQVGGFYQVVADSMSAFVKSFPIRNIFLSTERRAGIETNYQDTANGVLTWNHFTVTFPPSLVKTGKDYNAERGQARDLKNVLKRGLLEITDSALADVLEMISSNSLYRGEEHLSTLHRFKALKEEFKALPEEAQDNYCWVWSQHEHPAIIGIRNTVIGTLLQDLSEDKPLEVAVKAFEAKVAPINYKRPTAIVTKKMLEDTKAALSNLGLLSALDRRYAVLEDITVNNVLFADRTSRKRMGDSVLDELISSMPTSSRSPANIEEVPIETFLKDILPKVSSINALLENRHQSNLVSLIAPADRNAKGLFKWSNPFSWSYIGQFTDSIKERVKTAGGRVDGVFALRIAWFNYDDLDAHMFEPGGYHIYFQNRGTASPCGGTLDVDMNADGGRTRQAVENIVYPTARYLKEGEYILKVHNYAMRETIDVGFEAEVQLGDEVFHLEYTQAVPDDKYVTVGTVTYSKANGFTFKPAIQSTNASKTVWGLPTQTYHPVNVMMLSPNYWDGKAVGNKHYFFMLDKCANDGSARGIFNEFLSDSLSTHRKALELVGSKLQTATAQDQLSGLGFSSTQRNSITLQVAGEITKTIKVLF